VTPGGLLVVGEVAVQASVQDADESVAERWQCLVVGGAASVVLVLVGASARRSCSAR